MRAGKCEIHPEKFLQRRLLFTETGAEGGRRAYRLDVPLYMYLKPVNSNGDSIFDLGCSEF